MASPLSVLRKFVHHLVRTPAAVRAGADVVRAAWDRLMRAWLASAELSERFLNDLLRLGVAFNPNNALRLHQVPEANKDRGQRFVAVARALSEKGLHPDLQ